MATKVNWTITDNNVTVNYQGETHIVPRSDALADRLIKAVKENRLSEIPNLVSAASRIKTFSKGNFTVQDGRVMINGVAAPQFLSDKIVRFSSEGLPYQPLVKFAEKLQLNPSFRAVNELYQFLEKNDHPLTETGNFIAYKRVKENFTDIHSGTFDNSVGTEPTVPRNAVDEDSSRTCSNGLHVANWDYAHTKFASHNPATDVMLEVEVNPADVVAIPTDYNQSKMRVCKYKVLGVVTQAFDPSESLRVLDPDYKKYDYNDDGVEAETQCCLECGCDLLEQEENYCEDCQEVEEDTCSLCGEPDCYGECDDEEAYPYNDEFNY